MSDIDINKECQRLYDDIELFRVDLFHGRLNDMCNKCHDIKVEEGRDTEEYEEGFYQKYKKLFQRKPWEKKKADRRTLAALRELRELIEKTEECQDDESVMSPSFRKEFREEIRKALADRKNASEDE